MPKLRKAVFPVAGFGSRFLPVTKASPKEMMPVVDKPLVGNDPFAVVLADDLMDSQPGAMSRMAEIYEKETCSLLGVEEVPRDQTESYGIVTVGRMQGDSARIQSIVEKPKPAKAPSN